MGTRRVSLAIYAATAGMELCYLYLALALLREHLGLGSAGFTLILALYLLSLLLGLAVAESGGLPRRGLLFGRVLGMALVIAVAALGVWQFLVADDSVAGVVLQIGFCGVAWWLGNSLVRGGTEYRRICFRVQVGLLAVLVLAAASGRAFAPVILFFILAVFALSLSRWQTSVSNGKETLQHLQPRQVIAANISVLLPATILFLILSPDVVGTVVNWLLTVGGRIAGFLEPRRLPAGEQKIEFPFSCEFKPSEEGVSWRPTEPPPPAPPIWVSPIVLWLIIVAVFLGVLFFIFFTVRRLRARRQAEGAGSLGVEIRAIPVSLFRQLTDFFRRIGRGLWRCLRWLLGRGRGARFRPSAGDEPVLSVRAVYRSVLRWAARHGLARVQSQTPLEYLETLSQRFPRQGKELAIITGAYLRARYSGGPTTGDDFELAKLAWQRIKLAR